MPVSAPRVLHIGVNNEFTRKRLWTKLVGLREQGYTICVACPSGEYDGSFLEKGFELYPIPFARTISPREDIESYFLLRKLFKKVHFDIMHTHNSKPGFIGRLAACGGAPMIKIHTLHGLPFYDGQPLLQFHFYKHLEKLSSRFCDLVLSQNRKDLDMMRAYNFGTMCDIDFEGNGVDIKGIDEQYAKTDTREMRSRLDLPPDAVVLVCLARLEPVKNQWDLIKAMPELVRRLGNVYLILAGYGHLSSNFGKLAKSLGIEDRVRMPGYIEDSLSLISLADVVVLLSKKEGISRFLMETMVCGKPIVASNTLGTNELIIPGTGHLVEIGDIEGFVDKVAYTVEHSEDAKQMIRNARCHIEKNFNETEVIQRIAGHYARLLEKRR